MDNCATTRHQVSSAKNINAVFVPNVDPASPVESLKKEIRPLLVCWRAAWMTPVCSNRKWTFLFRTRNRGTKWIQRFRNSNNIRQRQQRINGNRNPAHAIGYAMQYIRSHNAVIRVYDQAGNVIETHEHAGQLKEW